jgi:hypothetical protein
MASNDVDIMSQIDTFGSEIEVGVYDHGSTRSTSSTVVESDQIQSSSAKTTETNGEIAKSITVAVGKRRKVVLDNRASSTERRTTRSGGEKQPPPPPKRRTVSKHVSFEDLKEKSRTTLTKRLQDTFQEHDAKVRELFHLTKFVTLVDYDVNAAKRDESEVFQEVRLT